MEGKRNEATHANIHMHVHTQTHYMLLYNKLAQCKRKGKIKEASNMRAHTHIDTETYTSLSLSHTHTQYIHISNISNPNDKESSLGFSNNVLLNFCMR